MPGQNAKEQMKRREVEARREQAARQRAEEPRQGSRPLQPVEAFRDRLRIGDDGPTIVWTAWRGQRTRSLVYELYRV